MRLVYVLVQSIDLQSARACHGSLDEYVRQHVDGFGRCSSLEATLAFSLELRQDLDKST